LKRNGHFVQQDLIASCAAFTIIAFCDSFRGNEVFIIDLHCLRKYFQELAAEDYVIVPLLGRFKGEIHSRYHLSPLATKTKSELPVRVWIGQLIEAKERAGLVQGPAFVNRVGKLLTLWFVESKIMERSNVIKVQQPGVIPLEVDCFEDFGISRSLEEAPPPRLVPEAWMASRLISSIIGDALRGLGDEGQLWLCMTIIWI
jgi:hypothetical protein